MCLYGNYKLVNVVNYNQCNKIVKIDACIADEIQMLNDKGVVTLGCCCGHGKAGQIEVYKNKSGKWKEQISPPITLLDYQSVDLARTLGYKPFPYFYADGESNYVWQMHLKSGCFTEVDCKEWHSQHTIPYNKNLGVINI
jgi:hypothetical protein